MEQLLRVTEDAVIERSLELERTLEELSQARDVALEASRFKSEFLANMSHEIRTPMNAIIGMTELLLRAPQDVKQQEMLEMIQGAGQALLTIIGDILDFSKIEAGKLTIEHVDFDLVDTVESSAELLSKQAQAKGLSLLTYISPEVPRQLVGDSIRLRQILVNLVGNAIKFSAKGAVQIWVELKSCEHDVAQLLLSVSDNGIGLTEEESGRLFQPFVQADGSTTRRFGGTGLGLSICRLLAELMGGRIYVDSVKGQGSTFYVELPFKIGSQKMARKLLPFDLSNKRILVVDDDPAARQILSAYLSSWSLRWSCVSDATSALDAMESARVNGDPFALLLVDLIMEDVDAVTLLEALGNNPGLAETPAILITAYDHPGQGEALINRGFKAYLKKPIKQSHLLDCITTVLRGGLISEDISTYSAEQSAAQAEKKGFREQPLILLADDNKANQMLAELQLAELGCRVQVADNGREALDLYSQNVYDLILMDCHMPEMDGFEACRAIRKLQVLSGRHTPVVAMTASAMKGDREKCLSAGMDDYLPKPVMFDALYKVLQRWLPEKVSGAETAAAAATEKNAEPSIDEYLTRLAELFGPVVVADLVSVFHCEARSGIKDLVRAVADHDRVTVHALSHKLKGSSATFRANELAAIFYQLEQSADSAEWDLLERMTAQAQSAMDQIVVECREAGWLNIDDQSILP